MDTLEGLYDTPIFNQMSAELKLEEDFQDYISELRMTEPIYAQMLEDQFYKENNMEPMQRKINEFRKAMDLPVPEHPRTLSPAEAELHIKMIRDEFEKEFVPAFLNQDLVEMYDAGIDVLVYVMGALSNAGFDIEPGFNEIMRSNMSKMDPETGKAIRAVANDPSGEPEGKILKGPAYSPPNLHPIINEQFQFGPESTAVYRTENIPLTMGIGGPIIGDTVVTMDHNGDLLVKGTVFDVEELPQLKSISISDIEVEPLDGDISDEEAHDFLSVPDERIINGHPPVPEGWPDMYTEAIISGDATPILYPNDDDIPQIGAEEGSDK